LKASALIYASASVGPNGGKGRTVRFEETPGTPGGTMWLAPGVPGGVWPTSCSALSPGSGINAAIYTRALMFFAFFVSAAALLITMPPYEWPTSTTGPGIVSRTLAMYAASVETLRSGFAGAITG